MHRSFSNAKKCGCVPKEIEPMIAKMFVPLILLLLLGKSTFGQAQTKIGPAVGSSIENFTLHDQHGVPKKLSDLLSDTATAIVVVKSAGWCSQSKEHLLHLQQQAESFDAAGLKIVCLSYDNVEVLGSFATREEIKFPLLADPTSKVIRQLGLTNTKFKKGTLRYGLAHPATIVIDPVGNVIDVASGFPDSGRLLKLWESRKSNVSADERRPDVISIKGNQFVDQQGAQVRFKGLAIADIHKIIGDGHWSRKHFHAVKKWGANIVRIPIHPGKFRKLGKEKYLQRLDEAVRWCEEYEMYVIIDWHSIGNLKTQKFESHDKITSVKETLSFWDLVSKRYADNPTVAFYEIFNEPARTYQGYGKCTWLQWKLMVEKIIDTIRANDKRTITLVAGFDWAYDLREAAADPIARKNIAYVAHPYPGKCEPPREPHWEEHFGFLANRFPIFVTETSFAYTGEHSVDADGSFRNAILKYLDQKQISWCAWVFDPDWFPSLIDSYDYGATKPGSFFKNALQNTPKVND